MIISLLGCDFVCPNKGCEALSYAFVSMLKEMLPNEKLTIYNITYKDSLGKFPEDYPDITFHNHRTCLKSPKYLMKTYRLMKASDYVFDITYGDSFSDIYGKKWLIQTNIHKQIAKLAKAKLILLPQTFGPFQHKMLRNWSLRLISSSEHAYSRDNESILYLKDKGINDVSLATDLAMALPYNKELFMVDTNETKIGLNVSSLLWENGFTGKNEFGLSVNYQDYCKGLIQSLLEQGGNRVYLIPHVIEDTREARENDLRSIRELHKLYPETVMPPHLETSIDIKSYISQMDVFVGARMHSTIAAYSSGVPVIPFSYSRKFEGLFGNLNYPYVIEGRTMETGQAIRQTMQFIAQRENMLIAQQNGMEIVRKLLEDFRACLKKDMELL